MKIILLTLLGFNSLYASNINLDIGSTETVFNRVSIPKSKADQISLPTDDSITSYRLTGFLDLASGNQLYIILAPLEVSYDFQSDKNFRFNKTDFTANTDTTFNYKFNSYRLGYLWTWKVSGLRYWAGLVGKIRDANTEVIQGNTSDSFDNIGFVPLLSGGFDLYFTSWLSLFSHTDALGSAQGSAYDSQLELKLMLSGYSISLGKRILGGGADNDTVYNFAQFDTNYIKLSKSF